MTEKLLIIVATHNRQATARACFENLCAMKAPQDVLAIFNDASTEYTGAWCRLFAELVVNTTTTVGIHAQRGLHFQFAAQTFQRDPAFTRLYLTDADCLHDPSWRENLIRIQDKYDQPLVCGYNTLAHSSLPDNTWKDDASEEVIWRKYAPGVSYLLTKDHLDVILGHLPMVVRQGFDWCIPELLGHRCAITRVGYLDHIGIGGDHHPSDAGYDEGDKVIAPTPFLISKRAEVIHELTCQKSITTQLVG